MLLDCCDRENKVSLNLHLHTVKKDCGCQKEIDLLQTPTEVSLEADNSDKPHEVYFTWINSQVWDDEIKQQHIKTVKILLDDPEIVLEWSVW